MAPRMFSDECASHLDERVLKEAVSGKSQRPSNLAALNTLSHLERFKRALTALKNTTNTLQFLFHRAMKAGMQRPLLVCPPHADYEKSPLVAALGALHALYMVGKTQYCVERLHVCSLPCHPPRPPQDMW